MNKNHPAKGATSMNRCSKAVRATEEQEARIQSWKGSKEQGTKGRTVRKLRYASFTLSGPSLLPYITLPSASAMVPALYPERAKRYEYEGEEAPAHRLSYLLHPTSFLEATIAQKGLSSNFLPERSGIGRSAIPLSQFFTGSLIQKGRGTWPCEALATVSSISAGTMVPLPSRKKQDR